MELAELDADADELAGGTFADIKLWRDVHDTGMLPAEVQDSDWAQADRAVLSSLEVHGSGVNRIILQTSAGHCHGVALHPLAGFSPYLEDTVVPALDDGSQQALWRERKLWTSLWYIVSPRGV